MKEHNPNDALQRARKRTLWRLALSGLALVALVAAQLTFVGTDAELNHWMQTLAMLGYLVLVLVAARYLTAKEAVAVTVAATAAFSTAYLPHFLVLPEDSHESWMELAGQALTLLGAGLILTAFRSGLIKEKQRTQGAERQRRERIREMRDLSGAVASSANLDSALAALACQMVETVGATFCRMLLLEDDGATLRVAAVHPVREIEDSISPGTTINLELLPHYRQAVECPEAVIIDGGKGGAGPAGSVDELKLMSGARSMLVYRLQAGGACLGLACIGEHRSWERSPLGEEKAALCQTIANTGALAVNQALAHDRLKALFRGTVSSLAEAIDAKDAYTRGHSSRVADYAVMVGMQLGLAEEQLEALDIAGRLHDVGKIGITDAVLGKSGRLTEAEWWEMKRHPELSARIIEPARFSSSVTAAVRHHHERYDGSGYPGGLAGSSIPVEARILAVVDSFEAMTADRPYRRALSLDEALLELKRCAGTQFDPVVVSAFLVVMNAGPSSGRELNAG